MARRILVTVTVESDREVAAFMDDLETAIRDSRDMSDHNPGTLVGLSAYADDETGNVYRDVVRLQGTAN